MAANGKLALCGCVLRPWGGVSWSQANLWKPLFILSVVWESWINTVSNWSESPNNHIFLFDLWTIICFSGWKSYFASWELLKAWCLPPLVQWVWIPCHGRSMRWSAHCRGHRGGLPKTARAAVSHGADMGHLHETHCPLLASPHLNTGKEIVH